MKNWNTDYWQQRWEKGETGWDIGYPSPPLVEFMETVEDKEARILIPGSGNAYEAEALIRMGFENTFVVDLAPAALESLKRRFPEYPEDRMILGDFFELEGPFDIILEQTFFCALDPSQRQAYADKMFDLLRPGGILAGVLFDAPLFTEHPPFGGSKAEYLKYFQGFEIEKFETARNSIKPRAGRELFIRLRKPY
jgi:SAM-dependent methyltransferase